MEKLPHLAAVGVNEQKLFHGTPDEATVRCICNQNFDPRMHGRHGTVYGKGVYFSATAKYSDSYTQPCPKNSGRRFMFLARILAGKPTVGKSDLQRPPPVDPSRPHGALFDSCVNSTSNPTIFVIFDNDQCYPEYLIEYEVCKKEVVDDMGAFGGSIGRSSRLYGTVPQSSASAAAISTSPHSSASTGRTIHPRALTAYTYSGQSVTPVSTSPAVATPAWSTSQTSHQLAASSTARSSSIPVNAARSPDRQPQTSPTRESRKGCAVM